MKNRIKLFAIWLSMETYCVGDPKKRGGRGYGWTDIIPKLTWYHKSGELIPDIYEYLVNNMPMHSGNDKKFCTEVIKEFIRWNKV